MNLSADELADAVADFEGTLNETCTINLKSVTNSGEGAIESLSERASNVPVRRSTEYKAFAKSVAEGARAQEDVMVSLPAGQVVEVTDQIVFFDQIYEVVKKLTVGSGISTRVLCKVV